MKKPFHYKKLLQYFLQGLLILAPVAITAYSIYFVVSSIDSWIPIFTYIDKQGQVRVHNYGIGFVVIIAAIIILGYFSSFFITGRVVSFFDRILEKTPGIKYIYTTTRDFFEAFAGDKKKFTINVLANVDDNDVWRVGFITQDDMEEWGLKDYVAVYVPMSYSVAGNVYIIPKSRVRRIENIGSSQSMKFAVSGGVTKIEEEEEKKPE
jgi:uncharacterized membrane protein